MPEVTIQPDAFQLAQDRAREERLRVGLEFESQAHRDLCKHFADLETENASLSEEIERLNNTLTRAQETVDELRSILTEKDEEISLLDTQFLMQKNLQEELTSSKENYKKLRVRTRYLLVLTVLFAGSLAYAISR